jgi:predicted enzyme related to lactoylglutathione lyase
MASLYTYGRLAIAANNLDEMEQFYTRLLQQEPASRILNSYVEYHLPELRLGLFRPRETNKAEFQQNTPTTLSIVLEVRDIDAAAAHFASIGCHPGTIRDTFHGKEFYAYDPMRNRLIVHQEK